MIRSELIVSFYLCSILEKGSFKVSQARTKQLLKISFQAEHHKRNWKFCYKTSACLNKKGRRAGDISKAKVYEDLVHSGLNAFNSNPKKEPTVIISIKKNQN